MRILVTQHMAAKIWRANGDDIEAVEGYGVLIVGNENYPFSKILLQWAQRVLKPPRDQVKCLQNTAEHFASLLITTHISLKAPSLLDIALIHTPTIPELHLCKARVLKRSGDLFCAARCFNDARLLDSQDRFFNPKSPHWRQISTRYHKQRFGYRRMSHKWSVSHLL